VPGLVLSVLIARTTAWQSPAPLDYLVYVASEAADRLTLVRFGPAGARVETEIATGIMPNDIDGPHGLAVSPSGGSYFVSLAHGQPFGSVIKYEAGTNRVLGRVVLGLFPATMHAGPGGDFLYVVNFNLHGDMVPSSVSVVETAGMTEIARIPTCRMPHGSRVNPQGTRHYSACMMDDTLIEIDTGALKVTRHFVLTEGREAGRAGPPAASHTAVHVDHGGTAAAPAAPTAACSPTWAQPSHDGSSVFVACNASSQIVEVDARSWTIRRRLPARPGVYNLALTRDNRLLATNKRDQSLSIIDLASGRELARLPTKRRVVHGVVVSSDSRYAFVSVEGVADEPGTVEVVDLDALRVVARVDVAPQAGGIDFWKTEAPKR
jgi:DNA-binding beta-propeller fold protein YncE